MTDRTPGDRQLRRALAAAAAVGVALVAPVAALGVSASRTAVGADTEGLLPSRVWQLPTDVEADSDRPERAAVAYRDATGVADVVLVSADDGAYHRLELPGYAGEVPHLTEHTALPLLSPDGALLAHPFAESLPAAGDPGLASTGVRVVRLIDGRALDIDLAAGSGVVVHTLTWSPDGDQLVITGTVARALTDSSVDLAPRGSVWLAGVPGVLTRLPNEPLSAPFTSYAVDEDGQLAAIDSDGRAMPYPGGRGPRQPNPVLGTTPFSSTFQHGRWGALLVGQGIDAQRVEELAASQEDETTEHAPIPDDLDTAWLTPIGWPAADRLVVLHRTDLGTPSRLLQLALDDGQISAEALVELPDGVLGGLSVATDLVTADAVTRETSSPPWEDDDGPLGAWGLGGIVAVGLLGAATWAWWVRRHR